MVKRRTAGKSVGSSADVDEIVDLARSGSANQLCLRLSTLGEGFSSDQVEEMICRSVTQAGANATEVLRAFLARFRLHSANLTSLLVDVSRASMTAEVEVLLQHAAAIGNLSQVTASVALVGPSWVLNKALEMSTPEQLASYVATAARCNNVPLLTGAVKRLEDLGCETLRKQLLSAACTAITVGSVPVIEAIFSQLVELTDQEAIFLYDDFVRSYGSEFARVVSTLKAVKIFALIDTLVPGAWMKVKAWRSAYHVAQVLEMMKYTELAGRVEEWYVSRRVKEELIDDDDGER